MSLNVRLKGKGPYFMSVTLSTTDKHETDSVLIYPPPPPPPSVLLLRVFNATSSFTEKKEVETLGKHLGTSHTEDCALTPLC